MHLRRFEPALLSKRRNRQLACFVPVLAARRGHREHPEGGGELVARRRHIDPLEGRALGQAGGHREGRVALQEEGLELRELVPLCLLKGAVTRSPATSPVDGSAK